MGIWSLDVDSNIKHLLMLTWKDAKVDRSKRTPCVYPKDRELDWIDPYILRNEPLYYVSGSSRWIVSLFTEQQQMSQMMFRPVNRFHPSICGLFAKKRNSSAARVDRKRRSASPNGVQSTEFPNAANYREKWRRGWNWINIENDKLEYSQSIDNFR